MGVAMKNNNEAAAFHVDDYDMVVNEECWILGNCNNYMSVVVQCCFKIRMSCSSVASLHRLLGDTSRL